MADSVEDSIPTTSQDDEHAQQLRRTSVPDLCGIQRRKSSELPTGKAPVHEDSDDYNMDHPKRGTCLVFNHVNYNDHQPKRMGTYVDVKRIQQTFGALGFFVDVCDDYKYDDIKKKIKKLSQKDHSDNDCVCIIVLTHGQNNNMIHASDKQYPLNVLWEPFTADNCITLAGKPKLFFISACRGEKRDKGVLLEFVAQHKRTETDGSGSSSYVIPAEADFLFGFSTPPGYCSWRSLQDGTWYIQSLCDVFDQYAETCDLVDMLTKTAQEVTKRSSFHDADKTMHNQKQVPEFHSRLLRRVYFTPKQGAIIPQNLLPQRETSSSERTNSKQENAKSPPNETKSNRCNLM